ncbi:unnamed protein product [Aphanomyces euteiches]
MSKFERHFRMQLPRLFLSLAFLRCAQCYDVWVPLMPTYASSRPAPRQTSMLQVVGDAAYIYGGSGDADNAIFSDTWKVRELHEEERSHVAVQFDLVLRNWTLVPCPVSPGKRYAFVSVSRPEASEIYIFGGTLFNAALASPIDDGMMQVNDVWRLDVDQGAWFLVAVAPGVQPSVRSEATAVRSAQAMVVFGGVVFPQTAPPYDLNDDWQFDFTQRKWQIITPSTATAPASRFSHAASTIQVAGVTYMVVFSGRHIQDSTWILLSDAWMIPLDAVAPVWTPLTVNAPFSRIFTGVVTTSLTNLWFFGGFSMNSQRSNYGVAFSNTLFANASSVPSVVLANDLSTSDTTGPSARFGHGMAVWNNNVIIYGGMFLKCLGDVWLRNTSFVPSDAMSSSANHLPIAFDPLVLVLSLALLTESSTSIAHAPEQPARPRGLSVQGIHALRDIPYKPTENADPTDDICPICLVEFVLHESVNELPCRHVFHIECIGEWLGHNNVIRRDLSYDL